MSALLTELTLAAPGCQARRHKDFALLTSLVFCISGQLFTWVCTGGKENSGSQTHRTDQMFQATVPAPRCSKPPQNHHSWQRPDEETAVRSGLLSDELSF